MSLEKDRHVSYISDFSPFLFILRLSWHIYNDLAKSQILWFILGLKAVIYMVLGVLILVSRDRLFFLPARQISACSCVIVLINILTKLLYLTASLLIYSLSPRKDWFLFKFSEWLL